MRHPSSKRYSKVLRLRWKRKENEVYISNKNNPMNFLVLRTQKETGMILGIQDKECINQKDMQYIKLDSK